MVALVVALALAVGQRRRGLAAARLDDFPVIVGAEKSGAREKEERRARGKKRGAPRHGERGAA